MKLFDRIKKLFGIKPDPTKSCGYHLQNGCAHVDGFDCDMESCSILRRYEQKDPTYNHPSYEAVPYSNALSNGLILLQCFPHYAYGNHPTEPGNWLHRLENNHWVPDRPLTNWENIQAEDQIKLGLVLMPKNIQG